MSAVGFSRPGLSCENCGNPFSVFLGTQGTKIGELPDPFEAKCPECGHVANYPHSAIQKMVAVGPR
jgi:uncharacterized Zn finger protein